MLSLSTEVKSLENPVDFATKLGRLAWGHQSPPFVMLDKWQADVLNCEDRYIILNCSRQSGKSTILMLKALHRALTKPKSLILVVAEQRQSNEDLRKAKEALEAYTKWLREKYQGKVTISLLSDAKTTLELANGSRIVALPANEKVRGFSAPEMIVLDEAAYLDDAVFMGIDPMVEVSHGQLILASTPNGTSGFYYNEWKNEEKYRLSVNRYKIPWWECPRISPESIQRKKLVTSEAYILQEYECSFVDDISSLFTEVGLRESMDSTEGVFDDEMKALSTVFDGAVQLV